MVINEATLKVMVQEWVDRNLVPDQKVVSVNQEHHRFSIKLEEVLNEA